MSAGAPWPLASTPIPLALCTPMAPYTPARPPYSVPLSRNPSPPPQPLFPLLPIRWLPTQRPLGVPTVTDPTLPSYGRGVGAGWWEGARVRREGDQRGSGGWMNQRSGGSPSRRQFAVSARYVRTSCAILLQDQALFKGYRTVPRSLYSRENS